MTDSSDDEHINDIILDEPMFYILTQFLETKDGKNIATVISDLVSEIRSLRIAVEASSSTRSVPISVAPPAPVSSTLDGSGSS